MRGFTDLDKYDAGCSKEKYKLSIEVVVDCRRIALFYSLYSIT